MRKTGGEKHEAKSETSLVPSPPPPALFDLHEEQVIKAGDEAKSDVIL